MCCVRNAGARCGGRRGRRSETWTRSPGRFGTSGGTRSATGARSHFPPLDRRLGIPQRGASARLIRKVCEANRAGSFEGAARLLNGLAGLHITAKQVQLLTERVGAIQARQRDAATESFLRLRLSPAPPADPIQLMVITADGGRVQTIQNDPDEKWKENKVGVVYDAVPTPEQPGVEYHGPHPVTRSVGATMAPWEKLGDHLSALANRRGYAHAREKVFISDGAQGIRSVREKSFPDAAFVLDWAHAAEHVHQTAQAAFGNAAKAKPWTERQKTRLWKGQLPAFFKDIQKLADTLGPPPPKAKPNDPRHILANQLDYFTTHRAGLDYPTFRKRGWPVGSAIIESTIKQLAKRVKGTEKHWTTTGAEQTLQVIAQILSEDHSCPKQLFGSGQ